MQTILASHFLAGAILTLVVPVALLVVVAVYWFVLLRRRAAGARTGKVE
jgi:heme/copper-type cytochrome/quinol oxidase subunit 2